MEAVGVIASAAQISVYAFSIASTIQDIRSAMRNGPTLLKERSQQLEVLGQVVREIGHDTRLHSDEVAQYLVTVQGKILRLHTTILARLQKPTKSAFQKLRAATVFNLRDKEVEGNLNALHRDCQILSIYMSLPTDTSGESRRRDISEVVAAAQGLSNTELDKQVVVWQKKAGSSTSDMLPQVDERTYLSPRDMPAQGGTAGSTKENLDQDIEAMATANDATVEVGNHGSSLLEKIRVKQKIRGEMKAKKKGKIRIGCTDDRE